MSNVNLTTNYLNIEPQPRLPVKSVSTSTISLLPRPVATLSHHRKTNIPKKSITTVKQQRATTTPRVHRRRTSSTSSASSQNWLTNIFSQPSLKKSIKSVIRVSFDNFDPNYQIHEDSIRYIGSKHKKKFEFGKE